MNNKFIWNITQTKKIKIKEIREYNIVYNEEHKSFDVVVYGFFGGGVVIFTDRDEMVSRQFIDDLTG
jgi:hypothetical protein